MDTGEAVRRVRTLSDQELLAGLSGVLGSSRKLVALLVAHLGEVEQRRLHLLAGYGSMFAYCTDRLGMSEDEAYRRIEVARLARCFPLLFERLATGRMSLSVAALLKAHLTELNHLALLDAVAGKTVKQAREVLAAWFPLPDVLPSIRKFPERRVGAVGSGGKKCVPSDAPLFKGADRMGMGASTSASAFVTVSAGCEGTPVPGAHRANASDTPVGRADAHASAYESRSAQETPAARRPVAEHPAPLPNAPAPLRANRPASKIEPLSPERYKVVFTADADLKRKLDLARDLLRHAVPDGDLPAIIDRALDLLLEKTLQRRFAKPIGRTSRSPATAGATRKSTASTAIPTAECVVAEHVDLEGHIAATPCSSVAPNPLPWPPTHEPHSHHLPNPTRRAALERDGLRCTWIGPDGVRCDSRAWLEHDHIMPRGLGGDDDPSNIRIRCRAHNRLAAEQVYGQPAIARIIARRRARKDPGHIADVHGG